MKEITIKSGIRIYFVFAGKHLVTVKFLEDKVWRGGGNYFGNGQQNLDCWNIRFPQWWDLEIWFCHWEPTKIAVYLDDC